MESILLSFNVMMPVFLTILLGMFLRKIGLLPKMMVRSLNHLCFQCLLPIMLFNNVRATDLRQAFQMDLIFYAIISVVLLFVSLTFIVPRFVQTPAQQSVVIQGFYRSNYVILGIPIVSNIYQGENIATITMLVAIIVPLFNFLAVYLFEHFNGENEHHVGKMVINIIKNPLIIGTCLGMLYTLLGIHFPYFLDKTLDDVAAMTIPLALMILGADLDLHLNRNDMHLLLATVIGRLLFVPILFLLPAIFLGFREQPLASLLAMYASPAAVSGYIMAQNANADHHLAGQIVVVTSLLSCFTLFIFVALMSHWHLL